MRKLPIGCSLWVLVAAFALSGSAASGAALAAEVNAWCGDDGSDWLCHREGVVRHGNRALADGSPRRLAQKSVVWVGASGLARITFGEEAFCEIGNVGVPSKVTTRVASSLFQQKSGRSSCKSRMGRRMRFGWYCRVSGPCPARLMASGKVLTEWSSRRGLGLLASHEDQTGSPFSPSGSRLQEVRTIICKGTYEVQISQGAAVAEARVGATEGLNRILVRVREDEEGFLELRVKVLPGPCPSNHS